MNFEPLRLITGSYVVGHTMTIGDVTSRNKSHFSCAESVVIRLAAVWPAAPCRRVPPVCDAVAVALAFVVVVHPLAVGDHVERHPQVDDPVGVVDRLAVDGRLLRVTQLLQLACGV